MTAYSLVLTTCPDKAVATKIAEKLVKQKLAACVNIVGGVTSVYYWQSTLESSEEFQLLIKTKPALFNKISEAIQAIHPYELPEIIAIKLNDGLPGYLNWIDEQTTHHLGE